MLIIKFSTCIGNAQMSVPGKVEMSALVHWHPVLMEGLQNTGRPRETELFQRPMIDILCRRVRYERWIVLQNKWPPSPTASGLMVRRLSR